MLKITQPHLSMNNVFPPINTHSRPPSEDLHGVTSTGIGDIHSASKHQQIRRQQATIDQQRRSPLRIIYRSSDYAWNDHANKTNTSNQALRAPSPIKTKLTSSTRHLANGILHENTTGQSMVHLPSASSPIINQEFHIPSATQSRHTSRLQRTNSHLDKSPVPHSYGLPVRSESYRSSRLDYGLRPRHTSSKQRTYVNSKSSFHDANNQDETTYQQQQMNVLSTTQRLHGSSFDLTTSRKSLSPNKTSTLNLLHAQNYHNSTQELNRNNSTRFATRDTNSKEQLIQTSKYRQTTNGSAVQTTVSSNTTAAAAAAAATTTIAQTSERHPSAQSYKSRDPNVSYAYTDVKKYIEENELMSSEKEQIIRNWILEVEKHRHQLQKIE